MLIFKRCEFVGQLALAGLLVGAAAAAGARRPWWLLDGGGWSVLVRLAGWLGGWLVGAGG